MNINDALEELNVYAELDGTEWGETIDLLRQMYQYRDYLSEELVASLCQEILTQHEWAVNNLTIVESTETITRTYKRLEQL